MAAFELSKWYADCATEEGDAAILYCAELRSRRLAIPYASLLTHRRGRPSRALYSLRKQPLYLGDTEIRWESRVWSAAGCWHAAAGAIREVLFDSPAGTLEWHCLAPRAAAEIRLEGGELFRGWGYVEHLRLTVPPWRLPITRLIWGRFISAADTLIWIDWQGSYNRRLVLENGQHVNAQSISSREVVLGGGETVLSLEAGEVLREGALGGTALSAIPRVERLFPASMLGVRERKWLSRAVLRRCGDPESTGMAIHEVVEWP